MTTASEHAEPDAERAPGTLDGWSWPRAAVAVAALLGVGIATAGTVDLLFGLDDASAGLLLALPLGVTAGVLAVTRFWWLLLLLLVARSSLDVLDLADIRGGAVDPAAAVGAIFVVTAVVWLVSQRRFGQWARPSRATRALYFLAAACWLSVLVSDNRAASAEAALKVLAGVLMFAVVEQLLYQRPARVRALLLALFLSAVVPVLVGLVQLLWVAPDSPDAPVSRLHATFVHPNPFANYLVMVLLTAVAVVGCSRGAASVALACLIALSGTLLVFTYTRSAWVAAVVGLGYLGVRRNRRILAVLVIGLVVVVALTPSIVTRIGDLGDEQEYEGVPANSLEWRVGYWGDVIGLAEENPVTGIGLEMVQRRTREGLQPHNVFVQALVETGLLGLTALLAVIAAMASTLRRRVREAGDGLDSALASAAVAVGLAVLVQLPSENLLASTVVYWYLAAAMTFGFSPRPAHAAAEPPDVPLSLTLPAGVEGLGQRVGQRLSTLDVQVLWAAVLGMAIAAAAAAWVTLPSRPNLTLPLLAVASVLVVTRVVVRAARARDLSSGEDVAGSSLLPAPAVACVGVVLATPVVLFAGRDMGDALLVLAVAVTSFVAPFVVARSGVLDRADQPRSAVGGATPVTGQDRDR